MAVKVQNPRKNFQFTIILPGLNPFSAQEVTMADDEFDVVEHGDTNFLAKTAGQRKIGNLVINRILENSALNAYMNAWMNRIQNLNTGGGELPSQYKVTAMVEEYSADGITVVERTIYRGVWPFKINGKSLNRKGSDNTVESIEFCIDTKD